MTPGRPAENRVKLTCYVQPLTARRIAFLVDKRNHAANTQGKIVDRQFGVQSGANVAGRGRKVCAGRDGRAKQKQSRAKRANDPKLTDRIRVSRAHESKL